ncbi:MAG TPA: entericidin A/B family lipoprotein [Xanthomonadaceae bacterium]|nr:entericidin A/B family lipoprotein [Xanthomonadaceae bacterium]
MNTVKLLLMRLGVLAVLASALGACNTMEGFGRDVEKVGGEIEEEAQEKKNY